MTTYNKIKEYFKNNKLEVLDKNSKGVYGVFDTNHYGAVSLGYLHKHLLKEKVTIKFVAKTIAKLCEEKYLLPIPCSFAKNLVFCNYEWSETRYFEKFSFNDNKIIPCAYYDKGFFADKINKFNNYLK